MTTLPKNANLSKSHQTRIDRNLLINFESFEVFKNPYLAWDLFIYQSTNKKEGQLDLFGRSVLDPYDFAKIFGRHISDLQRKVKIKKTGKVINAHVERYGDKEYNFNTILEHCIVDMNRTTLPFSKAWTLNNKEDVVSFTAVQLIKNFHIVIEKGTNKRKYVIEWYDQQIEALSKKYAQYFFGNMALLRKRKAYGLYNYLIDLRLTNQWNSTNGTPNFKMICEKADIVSKYNSYKKERLGDLFEIINNETSVQFDWDFTSPKGMRYPFQPVLKWKKDPLLLTKSEQAKENGEYMGKLFDEYTQRLYNRWKENSDNPRDQILSSNRWYKSSVCIPEKVISYIQAYLIVNNITLQLDSPELVTFFKNEYQKDWLLKTKESIKNKETLLIDIPKNIK